MATAGQRPTPKVIKLITGNPGHRPIRDSVEVPPLTARPEAPAHLDDLAKKEWDRLSPLLWPIGLLTGVDTGALEAYCTAYGRWRKAEDALAVMAKDDTQFAALIIKTKSGNAIQNPLVGVANKAMADMVRYSIEFGMTPSARSRIDAKKPGDEGDQAERYFS